MPEEVKRDYLSKKLKFHSVTFILIIISSIIQYVAKMSNSIYLLIYLVVVSALALISNHVLCRMVQKKQATFLNHVIQVRFWVVLVLLNIAPIIGNMSYPVEILIVLECLLLLNEVIHFSDIFDDYSLNVILYVGTGISSFGYIILLYRTLSFQWAFFFTAMFVAVMFLFSYLSVRKYIDTVKTFDRQYNEVYFKNVDTEKVNEQLLEFQEKVKAVNSEINYQRLNLEKAYASLERMNLETESLIEMMKSFAEGFDVERNVVTLLDTVMKVKKPGMVGLYIDSNVYGNEVPFLDISSVNSRNKEIMEKCMWQLLLLIKKRASTEPLVICEEGKYKKDYLLEAGVKNAVAFPMFENEHFYGVLVVSSSKYGFFEEGYSFYETIVMDFTTALRSNRLYNQLKDNAVKDGLTKVYNRAYFNEHFPQMCEKARKLRKDFSIMLMDIDKFKSINDTYGHLAGDEVIKMVAKVDWDYAKKYRGTAVRYGGEEFLLIMPGKSIDEMRKILSEMQEEIKQQIVDFRGQSIQVNVSMGVASYPATRETPEEVLDAADAAMYFSKKHGRGLIVIDGQEPKDLPVIEDKR